MTTQRRIILIDIENANGGGVRTLASSRWCHRVLSARIAARPGDHIVLACNGDRDSVLNVHLAWGPTPRIVTGCGPNGADIALLEVMDENLQDRFSELVLASGDGIFAKRVAELAAKGLPTRVIAHPTGLSKQLRLAATAYSPIVHQASPTIEWKQGA